MSHIVTSSKATSLPASSQLVEHLFVELSVGLLAEGQEDVPPDVLVDYLDVRGETFKRVGIPVHVEGKLLDLAEGGELV